MKEEKEVMAGRTQMVFITSDEDLVRNIASQQSNNTHIIDLNEHEHMSLRELSQLSATNDQVCQSTESSRKSADLLCKICGDRAIGFNYDALSCASCKAFFRRNAYAQLEDLNCRIGNGQCPVVHGVNRKCHRCRLKRCFAMGMRKEFIVKKEEKRRRTECRETNSTGMSSDIDQLLLDLDKDHETLVLQEGDNIEDWLTMGTIQSSFVATMQDDNAHQFRIDTSDRDAAVMSCLQSADQTAFRFINFFRQMSEFESLAADDRFLLMKYNILPAFPIYKSFNYKPVDHYLSEADSEEAKRFRRFCGLFDDMDKLSEVLTALIISLANLTAQDSTILSLLVIILVFSQDLSTNDETHGLQDPLAVNRVQSYYVKILWGYLLNKWGEQQACRYFIQLMAMIFRLQSSGRQVRDFTRVHLIARDSVDQITPLMRTFLRIS